MTQPRQLSYQLAYRDMLRHGQRLVEQRQIEIGPAESSFPLASETTHVLIQHQDRQHFLVANGGISAIQVEGKTLTRGQVATTALPFYVVSDEFGLAAFEPLSPQQYPAERALLSTLAEVSEAISAIPRSPAPETLQSWFESLAAIQCQTSGSQRFCQAAVKAMVQPGGLDSGMLICRRGDAWEIEASEVTDMARGIEFDPYFLELALARRETVYHSANCDHQLANRVAVFASPVFDDGQEVKGVLYGTRRQTDTNRRRGIRPLEALWLQMISEAVSAGITRRKHEVDAARRQVLLEQAFPAPIANQLATRDEVRLVAEERQVTILFADLMRSSTLCEDLPLHATYELLGDVMDALTRGILRHDGVVVDYYGDGVIAMWNAPLDQADHAEKAGRAGLAILQELPSLNRTWKSQLNKRIEVGVGIHSGTAWVGNSGSRQRLKYGPRGLCVNVASRIEKATRRLGMPLLVSEATWNQFGGQLSGYRLGRFRLAGIEEPVRLYAVIDDSSSQPAMGTYGEVLSLLEDGDLAGVAEALDACSDQSLDDMSLGFLRQQIGRMGDPLRCEPLTSANELIFDLSDEMPAS